ncbi:MAG: hypothetical protein ACE14V_14555 [bacterium]
MDILNRIKRKGSNKTIIAKDIIRNPQYIPELFIGLTNPQANTKYGCDKVLRLISETRPDLLYAYFPRFVELLDSSNNILKWGAIITISHLAVVDKENRFNRIFDKYYAPITGTEMITAANIISSSGKIAIAKPELADRITTALLKVESAAYQNKGKPSPECRNIACGHAIIAFAQFFSLITNTQRVIAFVKRQEKNSRVPVRKKAELFLKKYHISG